MRDGKRAALGLALLFSIALASEIVSPRTRAALPAGASATPMPMASVPHTLGVSQSSREARADRASPSWAPRTHASPAPLLASDALARAARPPEPSAPALLESEPTRAPPHRILLEPVAAAQDAVTASFAGYDTGAPRTLELWRVDAGRPERLGRVTSDAGARIHGPQLALPEAGIALVVTPSGVRPGEPGSSQPLALARAPGSAPADPSPTGADLPRWRHSAAHGTPQGGL